MGIYEKGDWIGTPVTVERSVNDLILVDDALNESMLKPEVQKRDIKENIDDQAAEIDEITAKESTDMQRASENEGNNEDKKENKAEDEPRKEVRRSQRKRNQRINIQPDEIGDDENDEDYK